MKKTDTRILKIFLLLLNTFVLLIFTQAESTNDSIVNNRWNFHFQNTEIYQYHPAFYAKYSGVNSLNNQQENTLSTTTTMFLGLKLWNGAEVYYNPEMSGGSGFSQTRGIAAFPNGEVYRVSDMSPKLYTARLYFKQVFALSNDYQKVDDDLNQLATKLPSSYISLTAGKFSIMDFFDDNSFSHDPRNQFYNWALMGNAAWDYPADTRGYTSGFVVELVKPQWALRFSSVMVPTTANGAVMDGKILHAKSEALEFEHKYNIASQTGVIRLMSFFTQARMGNYKDAIQWGISNNEAPVIDSTNVVGRIKYGFGINIEHNLNDNVGLFLRASWNDGQNETWAFTEIDRAISLGMQLKGDIWSRKNDKIGLALLANGLSKEHEDYLKAGGYGFIIGDGNLNYQPEMIAELYYSLRVKDYPFWLSPDYQFIVNPAYNRDRGPVNVFGIRAHVEF
jgi:high affinity Mn2+ porin